MPSEQYTTKELPGRILQILERARSHFPEGKARREDLRNWYEETFGRKYVPPEIVKNGYLQIPGQRGWYWLDPKSMNETAVTEPATEDGGDDIERNVGPEIGETDASFELEYQLRDFMAHNLSRIPVEGARLRLYVDPDHRNGIEYPSAVGPIDILAVDENQDRLFVFELKRSRSPDQTIGQLSRYMGWVKRTIADGKEVHGVIVARAITENLRYGVSVFPHVHLFEYEVDFRLRPAHELP